MDERMKCPNCSQLYNLKTLSPHPKGNIPLFLSCGHSTCQNCIENIMKFGEPMECKVCHKETELKPGDLLSLTQNKIKLYDLFPVNVYILGELVLQMMMPKSDTNKKNMDSFYIDIHKIMKSGTAPQGECFECHKPTSKMCQQCSTIICDMCFNKTHKNFIVFKIHVLQDLESIMQNNNCKTHKQKELCYYCNDCSKSICVDCLMVGGDKSCKNHNVSTLQDVNETFTESLGEIFPKVEETFKRLTKTAVDVGNILHNIENDTGSSSELNMMLVDIEQHFSKLICNIHKHKKEIIDIIVKLKSSEQESLYKAKSEIECSLKKAKLILDSIKNCFDKEKSVKPNMSELFEDAKKVIDIPWYLSHDESKENPLKVSVNEDLCALMSDYIQLEGNAKSIYKLSPLSELEGIDIPPAPPAPVYPPELPRDVRQVNKVSEERDSQKSATFIRKVPKYKSKSGSTTSLESLGSNSSQNYMTRNDYLQRPTVQAVSPFAESKYPKQLHEGCQEVVYMSHIVDPNNFYVQRACHQEMVKEMLREFRNAASLPKPSVSHVSEGKLYLAYNKADSMWQRCRVVAIDRKDITDPTFTVFFIDFGSTEKVHLDKLRVLPPAKIYSPFPLAIHCSLANCKPKIGTWTSDDAFLIQSIIDNKQAVIFVRRVHSTSNFSVNIECDVTTFEDGVSLVHALVFHERAVMNNPNLQYNAIIGNTEKPKIFMSNNDYKCKTTETVYLTQIVSPDKFYVRKKHVQEVYEKLCYDLEQDYNSSVSNGSIFLPEIGMFCVGNVDKQALGYTWARCIITELPGRCRVRVQLIDTGHTVLLHWTALRRLHTKYTKLHALATECHLAGVTPLNKKWSTASVTFLEKFQGRELELHVENRNGQSIGVTLYDKEDEESVVCINSAMIKHKLAISFGIYKFNKSEPIDENVITTKSPPRQTQPERKPPKKKEITILTKKQSPKKNIKESDLNVKDKGPLRLEAKILNYQSPSLLYVSIVSLQKPLNEMFEKIQKYYSKRSTETKKDWKVGDRCCTFCTQSQTWRRAMIIEWQDENAKVFYSDFAIVETVPVSSLRQLIPEFTAIKDAAVKCHLSGVMPAVGDTWPCITKEYLKELIDAYKRVFVTKSGNDKDNSMPIELWVYHTIEGSALEPNKSEWRCLNTKIIDQGLAIPDKSQNLQISADQESKSEDAEKQVLSFFSIQGSVEDWLQLEMLPTKPPVMKSDSENYTCPSTPDDDETIKSRESPANTIFISDWLPPEPFQSNEFIGMPTYIDNDGIIYLHDIAQQETQELIRKALEVRFKKPDPKSKYYKWTVGEPCIALYFLDNRFYRGRIVEVNEETSSCLVHYIDYGNEEKCSFVDLRKSIALYQIPIQAHKCVLNRIKPVDGTWDRQTLDYIHKSIVEKKCFIKITGSPIDDVTPIDLKYDKLCINDHLVDFEMAKYIDGSKVVVRKFAPNTNINKLNESLESEYDDSGPDYVVEDDSYTPIPTTTSQESLDYKSMEGKDWNQIMSEEDANDGNYVTYPTDSDSEFYCNISFINDIKTFELNKVQDDSVIAIYDELFEMLQNEGPNLPPLNGVYENKACVALFNEDGRWYRASVLQFSEEKNLVKVKYIDYGNIDIIPLKNVKEINENALRLPPVNVTAELYEIKINPNISIEAITIEYSNLFLNKGPFLVKVRGHNGNIPLVDLCFPNGKLVYEKLIEEGIFVKEVTEE